MAKRNSVLWQIQFPDSHFTSYLFGTMHLQASEAYNHVSMAEKAIDTCQSIYLEFNLDEASQISPTDYFFFPKGITLEEHLGTKRFEKIRKQFLKSFDFELAAYNSFLPILTLNAVSESLFNKVHAVSLDSHLWNYGQSNNLKLGGVESFQDQLTILKCIPIDYQISLIKNMAKNPKRFRKQTNQAATAYQNQEIHKLYKITKRSLGKIRSLMLYDRNLRMAQKITEIVKSENAFIGVGAAHLSGQKGVIHHLVNSGIICRPVLT